MIVKVNNEFIKICEEILAYNRNESEWAEYDISDMFQTENYCGGFETIENEFTFSYYEDQNEYWFQLTLDDIKNIANGKITEIEARPAELSKEN